MGPSAYGETETVKQLLSHGADVNMQDIRGKSAMTFAAKKNTETVELLLTHGAEVVDLWGPPLGHQY